MWSKDMLGISKKFCTILILLVGLGLIFGVNYIRQKMVSNHSPNVQAKVKGNEDALIKIVEFIDFECPACAQGAKYLKEIMTEYPNDIRLELKHYPLAIHRHGFLSSQYAECAAKQGKFWPFHDMLIARQRNWKRLIDVEPAFNLIAQELRLDTEALKACVEDEATAKIIEDNKADGTALRVKSTPTYFVNGKMVVGKKLLILELNGLLKNDG